jgi:hypothetical protein
MLQISVNHDLNVSLPVLYDGTSCHLSTNCTSIWCCTDVELISRSITTSLRLDPCHYTLVIQIEKLQTLK